MFIIYPKCVCVRELTLNRNYESARKSENFLIGSKIPELLGPGLTANVVLPKLFIIERW